MKNNEKLAVLAFGVVFGISACGQDEVESASRETPTEQQAPILDNPTTEPLAEEKREQTLIDETPAREPDNASSLVEASFSVAEVALHNTKSDCWIIIGESVYNITGFFEDHPGGEAPVRFCGRDATALFSRIHAGSVEADFMAQQYRIGRLIR